MVGSNGFQCGADVEPPVGRKKPCSVILPSGEICSKRVPFSYSASATRPPLWNEGCSSNQWTEQPRMLYGLWPSTYWPLTGRTSSIIENSAPLLKPPLPLSTFEPSHVMNADVAESVHCGVAFFSPPTRTN